MIVKKITPRGFCKGVHNAIQIVKTALENDSLPRPIYILGMIVHNRHIVEELTKLGAITLDDMFKDRTDLVKDIKKGTIILSAHGTKAAVKQIIRENNVTLIDATCDDVYKTQELIEEYLKKDYSVIYIGKKNHPETNAAIGIGENIFLVENELDLENLKFDKPIFVTNQTTFSLNDILPIQNRIKEIWPEAIITEEICSATRMRQNAIIEGNKDVDLCYIVGDPRSNNSKNLVKISQDLTNTKTFLIQSVSEINPEDLRNVKVVSVSSGASTPNYLTKAVIEFLENYH
jgi:4-hydroxy-3-methylbut-2-enyl diphosphate reductase